MFRSSLVVALAALLFSACSDQRPGEAPMGVEDHDGRRAWEHARLHDPATGEIPRDIRRLELAFAKTLPHRSGPKSLTWTARGPRDRGGRTRGFGIDITDPNVLVAGSVTGGIWRSTDAGQSWQKTLAPAFIQNISCLSQDVRPGQEQIWYAGTGENYGVVSGTSFSALLPGDGIFKSTDGGQSWSHLASTTINEPQEYTRNGSFKQVNAVLVDPTRNDSDVVLAAVLNGIFRSNDGGYTWRPVLGLDTTISNVSTYTDIQVTPDGVWYAAVSNAGPAEGLWRSTDGIVWTDITPVGFPANPQRCVLAIDPTDTDIVYWFLESPGTGTNGHSLWKYTYLSGDGSGAGGAWENRSANLPNSPCTGYFDFDFGPINTQGGYDMCIAVDPTDPDVLYIGGTNVYRSLNAFATGDSTAWIGGYKCTPNDPKDYVYDGHHPDQHSLHFDPADPTRLYSTHDGGVSVTTDALADSVVWTSINDGYISSQFYTIHLEEGAATGPHLIGGTQDNGTWYTDSSDPNDNWHYVHQDDGAYAGLPEGRPFILTTSQRGRLYKKTVDASGTVTSFERIDPDDAGNGYNFINQHVLDPQDNNVIYYVYANRVYRNTDLAGIPVTGNYYDPIGTNWEEVDGARLNAVQRISALDISLAAPDVLFYGITGKRVYRCDSLWTNPTKTDITATELPAAYVSCLAPNDLNADEWLLTYSNYGVKSVWHTADGGSTWTSVSGNLEQNPDGSGNGPAVFWGLIYPTFNGTADRYFVGTSTGLYSTDLLDGDNTIWEQEGASSIGNIPVNMITARNSDGTIAIATHGNGVYSANLPAAPIGIADPEGVLALSPPWPNPATDHVTFTLYTPTALRTHEVRVVDLGGRTVLRRSLGGLPRGNSTWRWDLRGDGGARVPAGTYLVVFGGSDGSLVHSRVIVP